MAEAAPGGSPSPAQKSSSPPEKSPSSATQKAPGPAAAGGPAKPAGAGPAAQAPGAFKVIRNQPQPEGGSAGMLMNDPTLYTRTDSTLTSVQRLLDDLRRNPKKYFKLNIIDF